MSSRCEPRDSWWLGRSRNQRRYRCTPAQNHQLHNTRPAFLDPTMLSTETYEAGDTDSFVTHRRPAGLCAEAGAGVAMSSRCTSLRSEWRRMRGGLYCGTSPDRLSPPPQRYSCQLSVSALVCSWCTFPHLQQIHSTHCAVQVLYLYCSDCNFYCQLREPLYM